MSILIGDIHGKWKELENILSSTTKKVIGVGDIGIGFSGHKDPNFPDHFKFIRGNHDNPEVISSLPGFLGDYGMTEDGFFVVGGADSIDKTWRTPGINFWSNEQMSYAEMESCKESYANSLPDIVISHEAPFALHRILHEASVSLRPSYKSLGEPKGNSTAFLLNDLFAIHRPKKWFFGHWHMRLQFRYKGTAFRCLDELETATLE